MEDRILEGFLGRQQEEGLALARSSDLLDLRPLDPPPARHYVAGFCCRGLVRSNDGRIGLAERFELGIWFPSDYLRRADPFQVLTWFGPRRVFHPNISDRAPLICIGRLAPGTPIVDILYQCFEVITYRKVTMMEHDSLNRDACAWARRNQGRFPVDSRPLKRRAVSIRAEVAVEVPRP